MFKIGEFSQLCQVSVRMLRHYEARGLLRPAYTDDTSGYRYYAAGQLADVQHILTLRGMGFSLAEAARRLNGGLPAGQFLEALERRRAELLRQREEDAARLERVEAHIDQLRRSEARTAPEATVKRVAPIRVASARAVVPTYGEGGRLMDRLAALLEPHGLCPGGVGSICLYHDPEYRVRDIDTEVACPLPPSFVPPAELPPGVMVGDLPAVEAAACVPHRGDVNLVGYAYGALGGWIAAHGYRIVGPSRVVLLRRGMATRDDLREVQWPVAPG